VLGPWFYFSLEGFFFPFFLNEQERSGRPSTGKFYLKEKNQSLQNMYKQSEGGALGNREGKKKD
jgi:hypothetical protein